MQNKNSYNYNINIETYDVGPGNFARPSVILKYQQEAGEKHFADDFGLDYVTLKNKGLVFVATNCEVLIHRMPQLQDEITINTWSRAIKGVKFFRNYNWYDNNGELLVEGCTAFALVDSKEHKLVRPDALGTEVPVDEERETAVPEPKKIKVSSQMPEVGNRVIPFSLLDSNYHLNNSFYADFLTDFTENVELGNIQSFAIDYAKEAKLGDKIVINAVNDGLNRYFCGMNNETVCFRGRISWKK